jgi:hypothetical protein
LWQAADEIASAARREITDARRLSTVDIWLKFVFILRHSEKEALQIAQGIFVQQGTIKNVIHGGIMPNCAGQQNAVAAPICFGSEVRSVTRMCTRDLLAKRNGRGRAGIAGLRLSCGPAETNPGAQWWW